jgi:transcription elongation factor Elf1
MVKICPKCKFANKSSETECSTCGHEFSKSVAIEPGHFSQHPPIRYRIQLDSAFQLALQNRLQDQLPSIFAACPHCQAERAVFGIGTFLCNECNRRFRYEGPFHITCISCKNETSLTAAKGKSIGTCSYCGQRYDLRNPRSLPQTPKSDWEYCCDCFSGFACR